MGIKLSSCISGLYVDVLQVSDSGDLDVVRSPASDNCGVSPPRKRGITGRNKIVLDIVGTGDCARWHNSCSMTGLCTPDIEFNGGVFIESSRKISNLSLDSGFKKMSTDQAISSLSVSPIVRPGEGGAQTANKQIEASVEFKPQK